MYTLSLTAEYDDYEVRLTDTSPGKNNGLIFKRNDYNIIFIYKKLNDNTQLISIGIPSILKTKRPDIVDGLFNIYSDVPIFFVPFVNEFIFTYGYIVGVMNANKDIVPQSKIEITPK